MTGIQRTLIAVFLFIALAVGTFIYFIANWDAAKTEAIGAAPERSPFILPDKPRGLGQSPSPALVQRTTA